MKRIGLIAGGGQFPIIFSKAAKRSERSVYAVAFNGETARELEQYVDGITWIYLGQFKKVLRFFHDHNITEAAMMGAIKKTRIFSDVKPDLKALAVMAKMRHTHDDGLLRAFAREMENEGISICSATSLVPQLLAEKGCWTRKKPNKSQMDDIRLGFHLAKDIGRLDIGQCVVVGGGSTLAVEAIDGTDATIRRGGKLGNGSAVVVKVCKPNQDMRFDIPAVGVETIQTMNEVHAKVLAIEAGKAVVFDKDEMIRLADTYKIAIIALDESDRILDVN